MNFLTRLPHNGFFKKNGFPAVFTGLLGTGVLGFLAFSAFTRPVFHDEFSFLSNSLHFLAFQTFQPYFTNYPSLYSYFISLPVSLLFWGITASRIPLQTYPDPYAVGLIFDLNLPVWLITSRLFSVFSWGAIVIWAGRLTAQRHGTQAALVAALLIILDPYKILLPQACLALPDVIIALLALAGYSLYEKYARGGLAPALYGAAVLAGLAAGLKLNGALLMIPVLLAPWLFRNQTARLLLTLKLFLVFMLIFLAGSPFLLITPHAFLKGILVEKQLLLHQNRPWGLTGNIAGMISCLWQQEALLTILLFPTIVFSFFKRRSEIFFLSLLASSLLVTGSLNQQKISYYLFLFPLGAMQIAGLLHFFGQKLTGKTARRIFYAATAGLLLTFTLKTAVFIQARLRPDNQRLAEEWIEENIADGASILLDWAYVPNIEVKRVSKFIQRPELHTPRPGHESLYRTIIKTFRGDMKYYQTSSLVNRFYQPAEVARSRARYLVTSASCYERYFKNPAISAWDDPAMDRLEENRLMFYRLLLEGQLPYRIHKRFDTGSGPDVLIFEREK